MSARFTRKHVGCYADGAHGWDHVRARLADLVECEDPKTAEALRAPMSDDALEEDLALALLQTVTAHGLVWTLEDGDLVLLDAEEME